MLDAKLKIPPSKSTHNGPDGGKICQMKGRSYVKETHFSLCHFTSCQQTFCLMPAVLYP